MLPTLYSETCEKLEALLGDETEYLLYNRLVVIRCNGAILGIATYTPSIILASKRTWELHSAYMQVHSTPEDHSYRYQP